MKKSTKKPAGAARPSRAPRKPGRGAVRAGEKPRPALERSPASDETDLDRVVVPVDTTIYPLDAVYGAAYVFLDRAYVVLEKEKAATIRVSLTSKTPATRDALMALGGEFVNELLNQAIRANLDESARKIREYIVVKSHYGRGTGGTMDIEGLLDQTLKEAFDEDPLDIAVPWEEKYGKQEDKKKT
jgi:His-Xaa-Ser system protein HxsD